MSLGQLCTDLEQLERSLKSRLTSDYHDIFQRIKSQILNCKGKDTWKFVIDKDRPLRFRPDELRQGIEADLFGHSEGAATRERIVDQSITVRIWSLVPRHSIDEQMDSERLIEKLRQNKFRRVVLRFRFEKEKGQGTFRYQLHIGGYNRSEDEYCRYSESLDLPRFPFYPLDLFLICEFLIVNLYPTLWNELKEDSVWKNLICRAQKATTNYVHSLNLIPCSRCEVLRDGKTCLAQKSFLDRWCLMETGTGVKSEEHGDQDSG